MAHLKRGAGSGGAADHQELQLAQSRREAAEAQAKAEKASMEVMTLRLVTTLLYVVVVLSCQCFEVTRLLIQIGDEGEVERPGQPALAAGRKGAPGPGFRGEVGLLHAPINLYILLLYTFLNLF